MLDILNIKKVFTLEKCVGGARIMYISKVKIRNFRNFKETEVELENKWLLLGKIKLESLTSCMR